MNAKPPPPYDSELQDMTDQLSEQTAETINTTAWHPKLTPYRLVVISFTGGIGLTKAILTSRGYTKTTTLEWVLGVIVSLAFYWTGMYEKNDDGGLPSFFRIDLAEYLWKIPAFLSLPVPKYSTDERSTVMLVKRKHPPITGYRLLVTITAATFGFSKAVCSTYTLNTSDWIFGVVAIIGLYWLGLYEASSTGALPSLFETDFTPSLVSALYAGAWLVLGAAHLLGMVLCLGWSNIWYKGIKDLWQTKSDTAFKLAWSVGACTAMAMGIIGVLALLWSLFYFVIIPKVSSAASYLEDKLGRSERSLLSGATSSFPSISLLSEGTGNTASIVFRFIVRLTLHLAALALCAGWTLMWAFGMGAFWSEIIKNPPNGLVFKLLAAVFLIVWSAGASVASALGTIGCLYIIKAFVSGERLI